MTGVDVLDCNVLIFNKFTVIVPLFLIFLPKKSVKNFDLWTLVKKIEDFKH